MSAIKFEHIAALHNKDILAALWALRNTETTGMFSYNGQSLMYGTTTVATPTAQGKIAVASKLTANGSPENHYYQDMDKIAQIAALLDVSIDFSTCAKIDMLMMIKKSPNAGYFSYAINKYNSTRNRDQRLKVKDIRTYLNGTGIGCHFIWTITDQADGTQTRHICIDWIVNDGWGNAVKLQLLNRGFLRETIYGPRDQAPCEVMSYSTRVEEVLDVPKNEQTLFGIELELENATPTNIAVVHEHLKKHAIMKRDGSLHNGVEIVSIPSSIEHHKAVYKPFFDSPHGLEAKANCGIHIHVSRKNLSFLALGRMLKFMAKNQDQIVKIAGRNSTQYAPIRSDWNVTTPWYATTNRYDKVPRFTWSKYTGLNILPNNTAEFRIFKSTTKWEEFCRFLEFTESFVNFHTLCGDDNHGKIKKMEDMFEFSNYAEFVFNRAKSWPHLAKFLRTI